LPQAPLAKLALHPYSSFLLSDWIARAPDVGRICADTMLQPESTSVMTLVDF